MGGVNKSLLLSKVIIGDLHKRLGGIVTIFKPAKPARGIGQSKHFLIPYSSTTKTLSQLSLLIGYASWSDVSKQ